MACHHNLMGSTLLTVGSFKNLGIDPYDAPLYATWSTQKFLMMLFSLLDILKLECQIHQLCLNLVHTDYILTNR